MAWRPHGRARVSPSHPQAFGKCDDCGLLYNLVDLKMQYEWRGQQLQPTGFKKCSRCTDIPFIFNKPIILPPDPVPVNEPRVENYEVEVTTYRTTEDGDRRVTMGDEPRITMPNGDQMLEDLYG